MNNSSASYQVIIAGGGPVGLFLGCFLHKLGISCIILDKRAERITHSRSLGIHPVSLELFQKLGLASSLTEDGIKIFRGHAFSDKHKLGTISFEDEPPPFNYILSLPQNKTEKLLEEHLAGKNGGILQRDAEITRVTQNDKSVSVTYTQDGQIHTIHGQFLAGCDGKNSLVRREAGIPFKGYRYPDTYIMGDFSDNTSFNNDAAVFLHSHGLVESFPLTEKSRRWVVKTDRYISAPNRHHIEDRIEQRLGYNLQDMGNTMISSFGAQRLRAESFVKGRIALAGDAAHIVSPIGGQGMNLGWLNAWHLSHSFKDILHTRKPAEIALDEYFVRAEKIVRKVVRRSEMNMRIGRKKRFPYLRNGIIRLMLNTPLSYLMKKLFTMRKLDQWLI